MRQRQTATQRFWGHVNKAGPRYSSHGRCWLWLAATDKNGYGLFKISGKMVRAHRWVWEQDNGPIPDGLQLNHLCEQVACVRSSHLAPVTCRENLMYSDTPAAREAQLTHCPQGHPYSGENLYTPPGSRERQCRICRRATSRRYEEKRRRKTA